MFAAIFNQLSSFCAGGIATATQHLGRHIYIYTQSMAALVPTDENADMAHHGKAYFPFVSSSWPHRPCRRPYTDEDVNKLGQALYEGLPKLASQVRSWKNKKKGVSRKGFLAKMCASLSRGALGAKCTAGYSGVFTVFWAWDWILLNPLCQNPLVLLPDRCSRHLLGRPRAALCHWQRLATQHWLTRRRTSPFWRWLWSTRRAACGPQRRLLAFSEE